jgi:hypothetical protein
MNVIERNVDASNSLLVTVELLFRAFYYLLVLTARAVLAYSSSPLIREIDRDR